MLTCPACSFENMDNSLTCGRCGAQLVWDDPGYPNWFHPPRAGRVKIFYPLIYWLLFNIPHLNQVIAFIHHLPGDRVTAVLMSIVPGLGHYYLGERARGLGWLAFWLTPLLAAAWVYLALPSLFLDLTPLFWVAEMLIHGMVIISIARPKLYCKSNSGALALSLILLGAMFLLYLALGFVIQSCVTIKDPMTFLWRAD